MSRKRKYADVLKKPKPTPKPVLEAVKLPVPDSDWIQPITREMLMRGR